MELVCPECGRAYEIPDHTTQRLFKCICRFAFTLDQAEGAQKHSKNTPPKKLSAHRPQSEEILLAESESSISDDELDRFVSDLRQKQDGRKISPTEPTKKSTSPLLNKEIEIDQERLIKKSHSTKRSHRVAEEEATVQISRISADRDHQKLASLRASNSSIPRKAIGNRPLGVAALLVLLSLGAYFFFEPFSQPPLPSSDPTLTLLLTRNPSSAEKPDHLNKSAKNLGSENVIPAMNVKEAEPSKKPNASQKTGNRPESLEIYLKRGNFDHPISQLPRWRDLGFVDRAHVIEAMVLSGKTELLDRAQSLLTEISENDSSLAQRTSGLLELAHSSTRVAGTMRMKSLQLTRARDPLVSAYLGWSYIKDKKSDHALTAFAQSLTIDPDLPWVQMMREEVARLDGRLDIARHSAQALSKMKGFESEGFFRLGRIARTDGQEREAISHFEKSLKLEDRIVVRIHLGELLIETEKNAEAIRVLNRIAKLEPSRLEQRSRLLLLGRAFCGQKKYKEARSFFNESLALDSNYLKALEARGDCEALAGDHARASKTYERVLKKDPQDAFVWLRYGRSLRLSEKSNPKAALAAVQRSLEIKETDKAHLEMAYALRALGRLAEAQRHLKKAMALNPENLEARRLAVQMQ
jgi:tetratricopeptide (TPR) repeat protein